MEQPEPKAKILFLDDDQFIIDVYGRKFTHEGYELHAVTSVKDALDLLRGGFAPDVIICDLVMAQVSGFDFLEILRSENLAPGAYRDGAKHSRTKENVVKLDHEIRAIGGLSPNLPASKFFAEIFSFTKPC